jgi:hypothetical protein
MKPHGLLLTACLLLAAAPASARPAEQALEEKGTYLGALFGPVSDSKESPRAGALVTHVLPGSPAAKSGLRRDDVILRYGKEKVRDGEHLARLIHDDKPDRKVKLLVLRGKVERTIEVTLALGLPLRVSPAEPKGAGATSSAKGTGKPPAGGTEAEAKPVRAPHPAPPPPRVSVLATPLKDGKMRVTIEYSSGGRRQKVTCEGADTEIARTVQGLPERERDLVRTALQRLRAFNSEPAARPTQKR